VIVRWGLEELPRLLDDLGVARPFVIAGERWSELELPAGPRWSEIPSHRVEVPAGVDGIVAVGGGSAIDTAKAASAGAALPLVSVPTTYSGAEWTSYFGVRDPDRRMVGGGGGGDALLAGIVYDPTLTLALPRGPTVGTAMNALVHCAEALYVQQRNERADQWVLLGARAISRWLPRVVDRPDDEGARRALLEAAMLAGQALGASFMGLGHAMAQAIGGRYGLSHGALNAICLPAALRFNEPVAAVAIERFGRAMEAGDAVARVEELARLGGFERLRDLGVPAEELDDVAAAAAARPAARANPRPASPADIAELLRSVW
jgi:maleylacetate reductase